VNEAEINGIKPNSEAININAAELKSPAAFLWSAEQRFGTRENAKAVWISSLRSIIA
jgi:hypothetical protein